MVNKVPQTYAMPQGLKKEDAIADSFIYKTHGFWEASPDRIVHDLTEETPGVAEFKFIQINGGETLSGILIKQHICVKSQGGSFSLQLNRNHEYFYQLYHQMSVTEFH